MRTIALMMLAALMIGFSIAVLSASGLPSVSPLGLSNLAAAGIIGVYGLARGSMRVKLAWRHLAILVGLEISQALLYLLALRLGPLGPVAGLHLSVPIVYLAWELCTGRRQLGVREVSVGVILALAVLTAVWGARGGGDQAPFLAMAMALFSALILAVLFRLIDRWVGDELLAPMSFARSLIIGLLLLPLLAFQPLSGQQTALALGLGLLTGPAVLLYWYSASRLQPTVFGSLLLTEAVWTGLAAALLFGRSFPWSSAISGGLILIAILIEINRKPEPNSIKQTEG